MCHLARLSFACAKVAAQHTHDKVDQSLLVLSSSYDRIEYGPNARGVSGTPIGGLNTVPIDMNSFIWLSTKSLGVRCLAIYDLDPLEPWEASARLCTFLTALAPCRPR